MRRGTAVAAAVASVAAVTGAARATMPTAPTVSAVLSPRTLSAAAGSTTGATGAVVRRSVICPDLRRADGSLDTTVTAGTSTPGAGTVVLSSAARAGDGVPILTGGRQQGSYLGPLTGSLVLRAEGALTGGFVAEQLSQGHDGADRGLAEARCEPARADQWFVGAATEPGDDPVLTLANPNDNLAVSDITVLTPSGISATSAGHNLALAPHSVQRIRLSTLAPEATATAVLVSTRTGQVSAAVRDTRSDGETSLGTDWVPVGSAEASVTVAGVPGSVVGASPRRVLYVADPGPTDSTVTVRVTDATGTTVPTGLDAITVGAGTVRAVDLTARLGTAAASVTVTSDDATVPVVAGVLIDSTAAGSRTHEIAYLGSAQPLRGAALIPAGTTAGGLDSVLIVSAPRGSATVTVLIRPPGGPESRMRVVVAGGTSISTPLADPPVPAGSAVIVVPDARSQPVYATRLIEGASADGPLLSAFELLGQPTGEPVPAVSPLPLGE